MKLKTSITILVGCLIIFIFIMLPIVLSIQEKKDDIVASYSGSSFTLNDVNNNQITEKTKRKKTCLTKNSFKQGRQDDSNSSVMQTQKVSMCRFEDSFSTFITSQL